MAEAEARAVRPPERDRPAWIPWLIALIVLALIGAVLWALLADDDDDDSLATDDTLLVEDDPLEDEALLDEEDPLEDDDLLEDDELLDEDAVGDEPTDTATEEQTDMATEDDASDGMAADGRLLLDVPIPDLTDEVGREVGVAPGGIPVVDVPADEGFTVGTQDDELFVYILPEARGGVGAESNQNVEPGSILTGVEGTVEPVTDEFLSQFELIGDEEAEMIRERGFYIAASDFVIAAS